jgi:hypothetical protein
MYWQVWATWLGMRPTAHRDCLARETRPPMIVLGTSFPELDAMELRRLLADESWTSTARAVLLEAAASASDIRASVDGHLAVAVTHHRA